VSAAVRAYPIERNDLYQLKEHIYSVAPEASLLIGKRSLGHISNYYPGEVISDEEVAAVQGAAEKNDVNVLNTRYVVHFKASLGLNRARVRKISSTEFTLLVASSEDQPPANAEHEIEVEETKLICPSDTGFLRTSQKVYRCLERGTTFFSDTRRRLTLRISRPENIRPMTTSPK